MIKVPTQGRDSGHRGDQLVFYDYQISLIFIYRLCFLHNMRVFFYVSIILSFETIKQ